MSVREITLEWVAKAEEDAAVSERESRVRKQPSPGAVCYHAQQCIEKYLKAVLQEQGRPIPKIPQRNRRPITRVLSPSKFVIPSQCSVKLAGNLIEPCGFALNARH
ncbi:MAG: HEPN domain-containing protein [Kiritimatiellae bacterium]|nr:HEPN domain-containing protein [Kiritimatiellia bacterium]MDD3544954.1 HEPN domain-containing protein [Kiritimatiellia bacterium]